MMAYIPVAQNTPWQQTDEFDMPKTAVLVIDVLGGEGGATPGLEDMASNSVKIVKAARAKGLPVVFSCDAHIPGLDKELELWGEHGIVGSDAAQPLADFDVQESDFVISKRRYDGFFQTDLDLTLRELGVDTLIAVGCDTNICVLQTLAGAYFRLPLAWARKLGMKAETVFALFAYSARTPSGTAEELEAALYEIFSGYSQR